MSFSGSVVSVPSTVRIGVVEALAIMLGLG